MTSNLLCRNCSCAITAQSKSGLCRTCSRSDPEHVAKRTEGRRKAFLYNPELRVKHIQALAECNRRPHRRAQSGEQARKIRLWEYGLPSRAPDYNERSGAALRERALAHIPLAFRDDYQVLVRKVGKGEATRIILEHAAKVAERAHG